MLSPSTLERKGGGARCGTQPSCARLRIGRTVPNGQYLGNENGDATHHAAVACLEGGQRRQFPPSHFRLYPGRGLLALWLEGFMRRRLGGDAASIPEAATLGRWKGGWPGRGLGLVFVSRLVQSGRFPHDPGSVEMKDLCDDLFSAVPRPALGHPCLPEEKLDLERSSNRRACNSSQGSTPSVWLGRTLFLHSRSLPILQRGRPTWGGSGNPADAPSPKKICQQSFKTIC